MDKKLNQYLNYLSRKEKQMMVDSRMSLSKLREELKVDRIKLKLECSKEVEDQNMEIPETNKYNRLTVRERQWFGAREFLSNKNYKLKRKLYKMPHLRSKNTT